MANETVFKLTTDEAQAVQGFLNLVRAQDKSEAAAKKVAAAAKNATREFVTGAAKMNDVLREQLRLMEKRRALMSAREERYVGGARLAGVDVADEGAVQFHRFQQAAMIRARRLAERHAAGREETNAASLRLSRAVASAYGDIKADGETRRARLAEERAESRRAIFGGAGAGVAALTAGLAAIDQVLDRYMGKLQLMGQMAADLEEKMRPLLSQGGNAQNPTRLRDKVLNYSVAYGKDTGQTAGALYNLESGTANFDPKTRKQIFTAGAGLSNVAGGDLNTNITALIKTWATYRGELGSVDRMQAKLFKTADVGFMEMQDLASLLPDVAPGAKAVGVGFDEMAAAIATATNHLGKNEKTFTAMRNIFLDMGNAQREGITLTGSLTDKLQQLEKVDPNTLRRIFGVDSFAAVAALVENLKEVLANLDKIKAAKPEEIFGKFVDMQRDPFTAGAQTFAGLQVLGWQSPVEKFSDPKLRDRALRFEMAKIGYESSVDPLVQAVTDGISKNKTIAEDVKGSGDLTKLGALKYVKALEEAGDPQSLFRANMTKLSMGDLFGLKKREGFEAFDPGTGQYYKNESFTGVADAQQYADLWKKGYRLGPEKFARYLQLQASNPGQAAAFLGAPGGGGTIPVNVPPMPAGAIGSKPVLTPATQPTSQPAGAAGPTVDVAALRDLVNQFRDVITLWQQAVEAQLKMQEKLNSGSLPRRSNLND